jgi:NAD-binding of NADP-dependent 3-hydroxyisobutyrate dehydrogenase
VILRIASEDARHSTSSALGAPGDELIVCQCGESVLTTGQRSQTIEKMRGSPSRSNSIHWRVDSQNAWAPVVLSPIRQVRRSIGFCLAKAVHLRSATFARCLNQIIVALTIEAVGEALLFASKAGADAARARQALMGGFANSRILEVHGERMVKRNFDPGFRIALHQKDLNLALQGARSLGVSLPNTATCQELFNAAVASGGAAWDHSAMVRVLERLACHEIGQAVAAE